MAGPRASEANSEDTLKPPLRRELRLIKPERSRGQSYRLGDHIYSGRSEGSFRARFSSFRSRGNITVNDSGDSEVVSYNEVVGDIVL